MINLLWAAVLFVAVANAAAVAAKSRATPVGDGRDLQQLQGSSLTTTVKLTGFAQPVSFHWSPGELEPPDGDNNASQRVPRQSLNLTVGHCMQTSSTCMWLRSAELCM